MPRTVKRNKRFQSSRKQRGDHCRRGCWISTCDLPAVFSCKTRTAVAGIPFANTVFWVARFFIQAQCCCWWCHGRTLNRQGRMHCCRCSSIRTSSGNHMCVAVHTFETGTVQHCRCIGDIHGQWCWYRGGSSYTGEQSSGVLHCQRLGFIAGHAGPSLLTDTRRFTTLLAL